MSLARVKLIDTDWPDSGPAVRPAGASAEEFAQRLARTRAAMQSRGLSHLAIYADREHFAPMCWLTGFDPRFEEALLIVAMEVDPLILVGNECESYLKISPPYRASRLRHERYQPFSLPDQPTDASRTLEEILAAEQMGEVGIVDFKKGRIGAPHWVVEALQATSRSTVSATDMLISLREIASPSEINYFEYTNGLAAAGARRIIFGLRDGIQDHELMKLAEYNGEPLGCHWTMKSGDHRVSLASARGETIRRGGGFSFNLCYWGSNVCRAGWVAEDEADLPAEAQGYVDDFAAPYFAACAEWLTKLEIGARCGDLYEFIQTRLPFERFGIFLNPGHLIHLEEWLSAPFYRESDVRLESGMVIQSDIIPGMPRYFSTRMEDGYALADAALRAQLDPAVLARCQNRQRFLRETLGIAISDDLLPLGDMCGLVAPFFLKPRRVFALAQEPAA